jgi:anti-sigma factor RsiW
VNHPEDKLAAFVDGELGHDARERVLSHLAQCADCRTEAEAQRRVKALLANSSRPEPSADLMARLLGLAAGDAGAPGGGSEEAAPPRVRGAARPLNRAPGTARPRGATGPRGGRPDGAPARVRPPVSKRRLTFAAAGAFSMMAMALSSAVIAGGPATGSSGRPAAPVVERNLLEQAGTVGITPTADATGAVPATLAAPVGRPLSVGVPAEATSTRH